MSQEQEQLRIEILFTELHTNAACSMIFDALCDQMGARNYDEAVKTTAKLLLITTQLDLLKGASQLPSNGEVIARATEALQQEADIMCTIIQRGNR
jgi:hypothetical protein